MSQSNYSQKSKNSEVNQLISRSHSMVRPSRLEEFQTRIFNFLEKPKCKSGSDLILSVRYGDWSLNPTIWPGISIGRLWSRLWKVAGLYHTVSMCIMLLCLLITIFSTIRQYEETVFCNQCHRDSAKADLYFKFKKLKKEISLSILFYIESIILIQYATEFILRLFSCGCKAKFHGVNGRFRFMRQFFPLLGE